MYVYVYVHVYVYVYVYVYHGRRRILARSFVKAWGGGIFPLLKITPPRESFQEANVFGFIFSGGVILPHLPGLGEGARERKAGPRWPQAILLQSKMAWVCVSV